MKVIRQILLIVILLSSLISFSQSFEGTLTYVSDLAVVPEMEKMMGITSEMLIGKMKQEGTWSDTIRISYKQGNYYKFMNPKIWSVYKSETNKIYAFNDSEPTGTCTVTDASIDVEFQFTGKMPEIKKLDTAVTVGGILCSIVRVKWGAGEYDYYYNSTQLTVNSDMFSKHIYDGWADFLKISKSLPLKIVQKTGGLGIMTLTLIKKEEEKINDKIFIIPELVPAPDLDVIKLPGREIMRIK